MSSVKFIAGVHKKTYLRLSTVQVSNVHADHPVAALCLFNRTAATKSSFFPDCGTGTPRESRYAFSLDSDQLPTAALNACWAFICASSVALAYWLPADEVAAPNADAPEAEACDAALFAELAALVNWLRCLRAMAISSFRLLPCGTLIPLASAHSLISVSC